MGILLESRLKNPLKSLSESLLGSPLRESLRESSERISLGKPRHCHRVRQLVKCWREQWRRESDAHSPNAAADKAQPRQEASSGASAAPSAPVPSDHGFWSKIPLASLLESPSENLVRNLLQSPLRESLRKSLRESFRESLAESFRESLRESPRESVRECLKESFRESCRESHSESFRQFLTESWKVPGNQKKQAEQAKQMVLEGKPYKITSRTSKTNGYSFKKMPKDKNNKQNKGF